MWAMRRQVRSYDIIYSLDSTAQMKIASERVHFTLHYFEKTADLTSVRWFSFPIANRLSSADLKFKRNQVRITVGNHEKRKSDLTFRVQLHNGRYRAWRLDRSIVESPKMLCVFDHDRMLSHSIIDLVSSFSDFTRPRIGIYLSAFLSTFKHDFLQFFFSPTFHIRS